MIRTEEQRRWWFANHPEYSSSSKGGTQHAHIKNYDDDKPTPEEVDSWVGEALKYERDPFGIWFLKETQRWFGTAGQTPEAYAELGLPWPGKSDAGRAKREPEEPDHELTMWEAFLRGMDNAIDGGSPFDLSFALGQSSRTLGNNLTEAGLSRPTGYAAHHIVPAGDRRYMAAVRARKILDHWGIEIDSAANGVWLPHKIRIDSAAYHRVIHAGRYYDEVARLLDGARSKPEAMEILKEIGRKLSTNRFFP
jgi:hypothetical protein